MKNQNHKLINNRKGISNKIVAVFVMASLLITVIGTVTVLGEINKVKQMRTNIPAYDSGRIQMTLTAANTPQSSGEVALEIKSRT